MARQDGTHPAFEAAQIAHAQRQILVKVAKEIEREGHLSLCMNATAVTLVGRHLDAEIDRLDRDARNFAWKHFLYLNGEEVD